MNFIYNILIFNYTCYILVNVLNDHTKYNYYKTDKVDKLCIFILS
jgi:hypothetical protein